jgi:hypothetical protein
MDGTEVVTSDDHKIGSVVAEKNDCVIIETGHVFKTLHAIPKSFVHEVDGVLRATVAKAIVDDSPKIDDLETWDCSAVLVHYGLDGPFAPEDDYESSRKPPRDIVSSSDSRDSRSSS